MKATILEKIYAWILIVILGGIILHAPISVGLGTLFPDYDLLIKSWKEVLMLIATILGVVIVSRRHLWGELAKDIVFRLIITYAVLHLVLAMFFYHGSLQTVAGLAIDLRYVLFFSLVYVLVKKVPGYRKLLLRVAVVGAIVVVGFAVVQLFLPPDILKYIGYSKDTIAPYLTVDKNPEYIRVNSTLRGPNPLGAYVGIVIGCIVAAWIRGRLVLAEIKNKVIVGLGIIALLIALWITYSRSALAAALIIVSVAVGIAAAKYLTRRTWITLGVIAVAFAGTLFLVRDSTFVSNVLLHENPNGGSMVSSNDGHVDSVVAATDKIAEQPLGAGIGSTGSASLYGDKPFIIENQYLFIAHEAGWLGLILFLAIFVCIMMRLWRSRQDWLALGVFASGIGLALIGLLQPVWVDDTVSIVWWGLAAIAIAGGKYARNTTKQKTTRTS
jgi:hypothetical protein